MVGFVRGRTGREAFLFVERGSFFPHEGLRVAEAGLVLGVGVRLNHGQQFGRLLSGYPRGTFTPFSQAQVS